MSDGDAEMIERIKEIGNTKGDRQMGPKEGTPLREATDRIGTQNPEMAKALDMMYGSYIEVIKTSNTLTDQQKQEALKALDDNNLPLQFKLSLEIRSGLKKLYGKGTSQTREAIKRTMPVLETAQGVIERSLRSSYEGGFTKLVNFINHASLQDIVAFTKIDGIGYYDRLMAGHDYMSENGILSNSSIGRSLKGVNTDPDKPS